MTRLRAEISSVPAVTLDDELEREFEAHLGESLREGQSREYTTATDRLTGEVFHVSVKLSVVR